MVSVIDWYAIGRRDGWLDAEPMPVHEMSNVEAKTAEVYARGYRDGVVEANNHHEPLYCEYCGSGPTCGVCGRGR